MPFVMVSTPMGTKLDEAERRKRFSEYIQHWMKENSQRTPKEVQAPSDVSDEVQGKIHNQRGRILKDLKRYDSAIIEYTASAYYFERSGASELLGVAYNNLASIYRKKKLYNEAHASVDRAIHLWSRYEYLPHALDQKAQILIDQQEYGCALKLVAQALSNTGDRRRWRAEFLCTKARAAAGHGDPLSVFTAIEDALEIADYLCDDGLRLCIFVARKGSYEMMWNAANEASLGLALQLSAGNARQAARKLGVNHSVVNKAIKKRPTLKYPPNN